MLTIIHNQKTAYTLSYTYILISIITIMSLMDASVMYKLFYNTDMPELSYYFRMIFELMPSFHFSKLYCDINRVTCTHLAFEGMTWVPSRDWETEDLFREVSGQFMTKDRYIIPSMYSSIIKAFQISLGYFALALYFDNVFTANRGTSKPFYFILLPSYWLGWCSRKNLPRLK